MSIRLSHRLMLFACAILLAAPSALRAQKRPANEIAAELVKVYEQLQYYDFESHVNPIYLQQMSGELQAGYQKHLQLIDELAVASPTTRNLFRGLKSRDLAVLAYFKDADAIKQIDTLKQSKIPADALLGKIASLELAWWSNQKPEPQKKVMEELKTLAKANPMEDALAGALLDMARAGASNGDLAESARSLVETELKGQIAQKYKARPDKLGRPLVITGTTVQGKPFSSTSLKGKVILVDFWATWCGPCKEALPEVADFYAQNHEKGLEIIGVSCDSRKPDLVGFLKENPNVTWTQLFGPGGGNGWHVLAQKFQIHAVPTMYVIDRDGILRRIDVGRFSKDKIQKLIDTPAKPTTTPATPPKTLVTPAAKTPAPAAK